MTQVLDKQAVSLAPGTFIQRTARSLFISFLRHLQHGYFVLKENDQLVGQFGHFDDELHAEVNILCPSAYPKLLLGGSVASGETFMQGKWSSPNLTNVIRIFARNLSVLDKWEKRFKWLTRPGRQLQHFLRRNNPLQAKKNIEAHYDLGNELYTQFLDPTMMYSAAIYPHDEADLHTAQIHKLKTICDKLDLQASDHLLEIGTGWGGLAVYAAKHYGCRVTTTTISEEQHAWAAKWIEQEQLQDKITLLKEDYRNLTGKYDKLVSIEMIEAVGKEYMANYFSKCSELIHDHGSMLLQAIIIDDRRYQSYSKGVDFIQKYIFPGGFLPSQHSINDCLRRYTNMSIRDLHDIGLDYAQTLLHWHDAFMENIENVKQHGYDEQFIRMWQYYLNYCEGGFRERTISTVQLLLGKPAFRQAIQAR